MKTKANTLLEARTLAERAVVKKFQISRRQMWTIWVFSETAIKMWQSGEDGKSI